MQARKKDTGVLYAIKTIDKDFLRKEEKVSKILEEKDIMIRMAHPFIVKLHWTFQTSKKLHFAMDFCPGGDLLFHLYNLGRFTEDHARFYFGEILLAMDYLNENGIICRDLKLENILLDLDGHIQLNCFGLSKIGIQKNRLTNNFCGNPEYMSPEMLRGQGYGRYLDFYSLGALLFEMLTGLSPFYDSNMSRMHWKILNQDPLLPNFISQECKSFLSELLCKDPKKRLGSINGFQDIKDHPWLSKIQWDRLYKKEMTPPYIPNLRSSNFDPQYTTMEIDSDFFKGNPNSRDEEFAEFDYSGDGEMKIYTFKSYGNILSVSTSQSSLLGYQETVAKAKSLLFLEKRSLIK